MTEKALKARVYAVEKETARKLRQEQTGLTITDLAEGDHAMAVDAIIPIPPAKATTETHTPKNWTHIHDVVPPLVSQLIAAREVSK